MCLPAPISVGMRRHRRHFLTAAPAGSTTPIALSSIAEGGRARFAAPPPRTTRQPALPPLAPHRRSRPSQHRNVRCHRTAGTGATIAPPPSPVFNIAVAPSWASASSSPLRRRCHRTTAICGHNSRHATASHRYRLQSRSSRYPQQAPSGTPPALRSCAQALSPCIGPRGPHAHAGPAVALSWRLLARLASARSPAPSLDFVWL